LSDEVLMLLVENARQLEEGSGVVVDVDGEVVTE
jgi:SOS-response transcriptional repressor LexA